MIKGTLEGEGTRKGTEDKPGAGLKPRLHWLQVPNRKSHLSLKGSDRLKLPDPVTTGQSEVLREPSDHDALRGLAGLSVLVIRPHFPSLWSRPFCDR